MILQLRGGHQTTIEYDGKRKKLVFKQIHHIGFICMEFQNVPLGTLSHLIMLMTPPFLKTLLELSLRIYFKANL